VLSQGRNLLVLEAAPEVRSRRIIFTTLYSPLRAEEDRKARRKVFHYQSIVASVTCPSINRGLTHITMPTLDNRKHSPNKCHKSRRQTNTQRQPIQTQTRSERSIDNSITLSSIRTLLATLPICRWMINTLLSIIVHERHLRIRLRFITTRVLQALGHSLKLLSQPTNASSRNLRFAISWYNC
jgi:hypothetical protein